MLLLLNRFLKSLQDSRLLDEFLQLEHLIACLSFTLLQSLHLFKDDLIIVIVPLIAERVTIRLLRRYAFLQQVRVLLQELFTTVIRAFHQVRHGRLRMKACDRLRGESLLRATIYESSICLIVHVFVRLHTLLHHLIDIINVLGDILTHVCIQS